MFAIASSACLAGFLLILAAGAYDDYAGVLAAVGAAIAGFGTGCVVTLWAELFVSCCVGYELVALLFCGVIASALAGGALAFAPGPALLVVLALLPLASVGSLSCGAGATSRIFVGEKRGLKGAISWRFIVYCLVFPIPLGLFQTWFQGQSASLVYWAPILVLSALICCAVFVVDRIVYRAKKVSIAEKLIMPVSVAGLFFLVSFDPGASLAGGVLVFASQQIMSTVLYARFGLVALREEVAPAKVFALGISATDCGFILGIAAGNLMRSTFADHGLYLVLGIVYLIVITAFLGVGSFSRKEATARSLDSSQLSLSLHDVAQSHGLTPREVDILEYLSRGKSVPAIASEVFLSVNTVRTHISHIYQKFEVHSRDELVTALDRELEGVSPNQSLH